MAVLVIAEHEDGTLNPAVLNAVTAAQAMGDEIDLLLAGESIGEVAKQAAAINGVRTVLTVEAPHYAHLLPENLAALVVSLTEKYTHLVAAATSIGKNLMPRVAALLDVAVISDITGVESADTFIRPIYAGNAIATVQSADATKVVTVRKVAFDAAPGEGGSAAITALDAAEDKQLASFVSKEETGGERPELTGARIVISGGRGIGSAENFAVLETLADKLGAAIGASRAAVDAGYAPNDWQVGQTGKVVAPELYIAVGISGAIQHLAGMKDSKVIVAINKDENAPIFEVADYGLVADLFKAVPELESKL